MSNLGKGKLGGNVIHKHVTQAISKPTPGQSEHIMSNPLNHIFATHDQSANIYGSASGKQCMTIGYYALAYNISFKSVDTWCQPDLDVIMFQGSEIYKAHKPSHSMYFSSDELPKKVKITSKTFDSNQVFGLEFSGYLHGLDSARDK